MLHMLHDGTPYDIAIEENRYRSDDAKGFKETLRKNRFRYMVCVRGNCDSLEDDWHSRVARL